MREPLILFFLLLFGAIGSADTCKPPPDRVKLELYDITPWTYVVMDFGGGVVIVEEPDQEGMLCPEEFAAKVMKAIVPGRWGDKKGWSIHCQTGLLIVRAPTHIHQEIATYLKALKTILPR
jgi:hypothetical protein